MSLETLTRAINGAFRVFRMQADAGKEKFGNAVRTFSNTMIPACTDFYGQLAIKTETKDDVAILIQQRCLLTADSVMDTSAERFENGNEPRDVFSLDRAAIIAMTEATYHINAAKMIRAKATGKKLKWVTGGKPCKECKSLNGKVVKPGQPFRTRSGKEVLQPGLHPSCFCKLVTV